jgi:hypothetical protein
MQATLQGTQVAQSAATNFSLYQRNSTVGCYEALRVQQHHDSDSNDVMQLVSGHVQRAVTLTVNRRRPRELTEEEDGIDCKGTVAVPASTYPINPGFVYNNTSNQQKRVRLG